MESEERLLRVFISSPSDLAGERLLAREVIGRLSGTVFGGKRVRLETLLWEDGVAPEVGEPAQSAVDYYLGRAREADLFVCMFWTRLGSPCVIGGKRHRAGTLYEFEDAYSSRRRTGRPRILMYRCTRGPDARSTEITGFFERFHGEQPELEGLPRSFVEPQDLSRFLERDLSVAIEKVVIDLRESTGGRLASDERRMLLENVERFLANFENLLGEAAETEAAFTIRLRAQADPERPEAVTPEGVLPGAGESLAALYERWGRRVLFTGSVGSGKTFAMLELMRRLIERARLTGRGEIPVYFNLSSWAMTRSLERRRGARSWWRGWLQPEVLNVNPTLDAWLVDELVRRYSVPRRAAQRLVQNRQIVFCLDGLDELSQGEEAGLDSAELRAECVETINRTLKDHSVQMVLCCRDIVYGGLADKPLLGFPLEVQPLKAEDRIEYLKDWVRLDGLRAAIAESEALAERARSPLFLRMMAVAYSGMDNQAILRAAQENEEVWRGHLLDHYVQQCVSLVPARPEVGYTKEQLARYLGFVARRTENEFLVEDLQPSELQVTTGRNWYRLYRVLSVGVLALILAVTAAVPPGVAIGLEWSSSAGAWEGLWRGAALALICGAVTFVLAIPAFATKRWWVFGLLLGVALGIVRGLTTGMSAPVGLGGTLHDGAMAALATVPCAIVVFLLLGYQMLGKIEQYKRRYPGRPGIEQYEIQPLETLDWHWIDRQTWWRGGWLGLVIGPAVGLLLGYWFGPARGVSFGLIVTLFVAVFSGLSGTGVRISLGPNQGIERSLRHALLMTLLFGFAGVLAFGVSYGSGYGAFEGLVNGILGLSLTFTFLVFGGIPVIRQAILGHVLHLRGATPSWFGLPPWGRTIAFLDDMVRFKLLRRSAGGYMFRHESLRRYYQRADL